MYYLGVNTLYLYLQLFHLNWVWSLPDYNLSLSCEIQGTDILYLQVMFTLPLVPGIRIMYSKGSTLTSECKYANSVIYKW